MSDPVFFKAPEPVPLARIAEVVDGRILRGDERALISGLAPLDLSGPGDLTFIDNTKYLDQLGSTRATACLCAEKFADRIPADVTPLVVAEPYRAFAKAAGFLYPEALRPQGVFGNPSGTVSPKAVIHETARLEADVTVEPGAVIGAGVEIGTGTVVSANAVIGHDVRIGRQCSIGPNATVQCALIGNNVIIHPGVQIGQDGFGFAMGPGGHTKVPQTGRVVIQDHVEIGANTTIDRGANRDTIIGEGTKIDNQVQIAHNVVIGRHCVLVAMAGVSGSTVLEDYAVLAGKVGVSGHLRIGKGAQIAGSSNVADDVPAGERWVGTPAKPIRDWMREEMALRELGRRTGKKTGKERHLIRGASRSVSRRGEEFMSEEQQSELSSADIMQIMALLPHRYPFLMVDRIVDIDGDNSAIGIKNVTINEPHFQGHFPDQPVMPGVLLIEGMAQTAGAICVHARQGTSRPKIVYFMTIDKAKFRKPVVPGDTVEYHVQKIRSRGTIWKFRVDAVVAGTRVAEAEISAMLVDE